jgi:hypothetical protein
LIDSETGETLGKVMVSRIGRLQVRLGFEDFSRRIKILRDDARDKKARLETVPSDCDASNPSMVQSQENGDR